MRSPNGEWAGTAAVWALLGVLLLGAAGSMAVYGFHRLGFMGEEGHVRVIACENRNVGRGGFAECVAEPTENGGYDPAPGTVTVRHKGAAGDVIAVRSTLWGTPVVVDTGPLAWAVACVLPLLPLGAAVGCANLARRAWRRATARPASAGSLP